jgi:hypothetical protein
MLLIPQLILHSFVVQYGSEPVSWFQKKIRGDTPSLCDHVAKEMNELNLIRCKHIPKRPGCDWHDLPDEKVLILFILFCCFLPSWCPCDVADFHDADAGEAIHRANGGVDPLVLAQHSPEAQSVERPVREARLGGQLPHVCDRSPANGQGRHVLPP